MLIFLIRCPCSMDDDIKHDDRSHYILSQMGQRHQPNSLAWSDNDWLQSGIDCCSGDHLSREPDLSLQMAYAPCDPVSFCNNLISRTLGKDQNLGDNRRYCKVLKDLGRHLKWSISILKCCELPFKRVVASITYVVNDSKKKLIYIWGGKYQHVDQSIGVSLFSKWQDNQIDPILDIIIC